MFATSIPELPYADPWLSPTQDRLAMLTRGERRVAYYYEEPNTSTFRYRAYNMAQLLNAQPGTHYSASWFFRRDLGVMDRIAEQADVLVVCRSGYEHRLIRLIDRFTRLGKQVLFDIDDLVIDTRYAHLLISTLGLDKDDPRIWDDWFGMIARMRATLERCDGVITTNDFLAERIRELTGKPAVVVPNFMNREQIAVSQRLWSAKRDAGFEASGPPMLGYFSGTPSHRFDYATVEPAIARLMERRPTLGLMLVGFIAPGPALARFEERIQRQPFMDWINLQRLVASVEVNLMPLQANVFTDCKSPLKYFEAAAVGTVSVASPTVNHLACIAHGINGRIARGHEWEQQIDAVLEAPEVYRAMAESAHADAIRHHAWTEQLPVLLQALGWR
ncbi:MAG TPA: glycosyltransferase [Rubrivivax sp.]|nr:glycosyltransferase [Rubrivivax sp.]